MSSLVLALVVGGSRLRDEVAAALAGLPVDVARAADHAAALEALRGVVSAIVLCDWSMPDAAATQSALAAACDGLEAALIAVSDESDPAQRAAMLAAGAVDVLALPADGARLQMRALHALERARSGVDAQLYRRVFERNPLSMCLIDDDSGRFLAVSDGALVQYGWSREEFLGMLLRDVRPPEMIPAFEAACARPEPLVPILTTHWRKDGTRFTSQGLLQRFTVGQRRLRFAVSRDVTDEAHNAETHRRALAAYQRLVERSADGILNHRADDFAVTYANPALVAFLGYDSADELIGRSILGLVDPADADTMRTRVGHIVSSQRASPPGAVSFIAADGSRKWAETRGFVGDFDGPVVTVLVRDLTERRQAEEALRRSEQRFAGIFHATPAAISLTRISDGHFLDVNERWVEFTGFARADVLGKSAAELGLWHDPAARERLYAEIHRTGSARDIEVRLNKRGGEPIVGLASAETTDLGGEPCLITITVDISERKAFEEQLRHSNKMEAVGRLAGGVAHDFNNLLTAIRGYSEVLKEQSPAGSITRDAAEHIHRSALRAASLTEQLLVFTRRRPTTMEVVRLDAIVQPVGVMLRRMIIGNITIELQLDCGEGCVRVAPAQLEQVIVNLAVNARDAMPSGGRLVIATDRVVDRQGKRRARLRVSDDGVGMDEQVRARMFEPFFTTKQVGRGTGLGLAIVYGVVEQSGGVISVETAPGRGTRFEILLPEAKPPAVLAEELKALRPAGGSEVVLLVDDELDVRDFVELVLTRAGYRLLVADNGARALELAQARRDVQLLVSDVVMPNMNGHELAARLRQLQPALKVLHISGYASADAAEPLLQKPFSAADLLRQVRAALDAAPAK